MFKPELYQQSNSIPKTEAIEALQRYAKIIKWKESDAIVDLGCGDGDVTTSVLKNIAPFERVVGCDVSEKMVKFANQTYGDDRTEFKVFDLGGSLPEELKESFDHAFSFYAIHWIKNCENVFSNIYDLLKVGSDCLLIFPAYTVIHDFYRALSQQPKWKHLLRNVNDYVSPYQDCQEPHKQVAQIMKKIGFSKIEVKCKRKSYVNNIDLFKTTMEAICPFDISAHLQKDFMEDYIEVVRNMRLIHEVAGQRFVRVDYNLVTVYAKK